ncbi:MAG: rRNA maturation RNase YbeY [Candidatus Melainabacteria bacterium]|nr:rRNA maturation RNase YbeY [Candidatus Melainabacteria bacterium]
MDSLFDEVCRNLRTDAARHITKKHLKIIAERGSIELMFVGNKKIQELNQQFRGKDAPTDVLSFPLIFDGEDVDFPPDFGQERFELGEIVISLEKAQEQALDFGHSLDREIAFLFVHGVLHVLGFDHITKAQEKDMFSRQKLVLDAAGVSR